MGIQDWCPYHMEPFRDEWPKGAIVAGLTIFDALMRNEELQRHAESVGKADDFEAALTAIKSEYQPLCCFVGDEVMADVYEKAEVTPVWDLPRERRRAVKKYKGQAWPRQQI